MVKNAGSFLSLIGAVLLTVAWSCGGEEFTSNDSDETPGGEGGGNGQGEPGGLGLPGGPGSGAPGGAPNYDDLEPISSSEANEQLGALCTTLLACECGTMEEASLGDCTNLVGALMTGAVSENAEFTYDGACIAKVLTALDYLECASLSQVAAYFDLAVAVATVGSCKLFYGTGMVGDECTVLEQSNGDSCGQALVCEGGSCVARPRTGLELSVCETQDDCALGLVCVPEALESDTKLCVDLPSRGEPCYLGALCELGTSCIELTCEELPGTGDACAAVPDWAERSCAPDAQCVDGECKPLPGMDEDCTESEECAPGFACDGETCTVESPVVCGGDSFPLFPNSL